MCGRYHHQRASTVKKIGPFQVRIDWEPLFNVSPTQLMPVIVWEDLAPRVYPMRWGVIPSWSKEPKMQFSTINAKAETLNTSRIWKPLLQKKRCLVPADGFYEWESILGKKMPWRFTLKNEEPFCFAGLWDMWEHPSQAPELRTYTIITTTANKIVERVHNRMPVILHESDYETWLREPREDLLKPFPEAEMEEHKANPWLNKPGNDSAECLKPWE
jgi:putative SOS response-associated peptidase YedK